MMFVKDIETIDIQNGSILLVDKPLRWTSFDVVNKIKYKIRHLYGVRKFKIGHAGTLDPLATGLLIICTGKCTKQIAALQEQIKKYTGTFVLGATTASYDMEKTVENFMPYKHLSETDILAAVSQFTGVIQQLPPVFSAVRINGIRAFEYARKKMDVVLHPKEVTVYSFDITRIELPEIDFEITCSKGTYIRSIARDLGEVLGCGAYLSCLRRTKIGDFSVEDAMKMTSISNEEKITTPNRKRKRRDFEQDINIPL
ncbi:MAG: tRNA pseudouridine(55) synthase TruB [Bacteroidales bacterium]|jgi:tRNA pseudouridine55 synthase|nr:tRNA pseudouridine(55) synthase TruB [Bacteroidales bacterium]